MEIIQWISALGSIILLSYLLVGIALPLFLYFAISRPLGLFAGSIAVGLATLAHMIMVPIQSAIGVPKSIEDRIFMRGISFGDLIEGKLPSFEITIALCCMLSALIGGVYVAGKFTRLISRIENIPTSTARAAAIGLAEFKGRVVPAPHAFPEDVDWPLFRMREEDIIDGRDVEIPAQYLLIDGTEQVTFRRGNTTISEPLPLMKWSAFYLEDETGRILVDPRRVQFGGLIFAPFVMGSAQALHLTKHWESTKRGARRFLKPGDRVYVIGTVQENESAPSEAIDSARLVVRPKTPRAPGRQRPFMENPFFTGNLDDAFILSDDREMDITATLRQGRTGIIAFALILTFISTLYLAHYFR